jgi:Ser/Thr protein kinase RdoA (MazF antagonist)
VARKARPAPRSQSSRGAKAGDGRGKARGEAAEHEVDGRIDENGIDEDDVDGNRADDSRGNVAPPSKPLGTKSRTSAAKPGKKRRGEPPDLESAAAPYAGLTPDAVLDALDSVGLRGDGRLLALNSYENRVYQVWLEEDAPGVNSAAPSGAKAAPANSVVAKFYRPERWTDAQIAEEHAFVTELADRELPVVAPMALGADPGQRRTLAHFNGLRFAMYPRRGGRAPELEDRETLEWMGRFIGRIHAVGAVRPFSERPALDIDSHGYEPRDWLLGHDFIPPDLSEAWTSVADQALEEIGRCYERAGDVGMLRLHGDCHSGNVLWTNEGPHFVDFDDARMGPAVQDLWMLLSGDRAAMSKQLADVLSGYEAFHDFDPRELHLVEALRTLRLIHYSAWIARRWQDPAFPAAFPWFNTQRYWQDRVLELREQIALMQEPPLWSN